MKKKALIGILIAAAWGLAAMAQASPTVLTTQKMIRSGITPTVTTMDSANGNAVKLYTDGIFLRITNGPNQAAGTSVTAVDQLVNDQGYTTNAVLWVPAAGTQYFGPFKRSRWADSSGYLQLTEAGDTHCAVEVIRLPFGEPESQTK